MKQKKLKFKTKSASGRDHTCLHSQLRKQKQGDCCESEASLYYTVCSRLPSKTLPHTQHDKQSRANEAWLHSTFQHILGLTPILVPLSLGEVPLTLNHLISRHPSHFLGLYDQGLTNSFGDHPQWGGEGITWPCYGSQSHLFRRANTHQWRVNATDWEGSPAQVSVGTYPHTLWIFPPSPTSQQGLVDLLRHLFRSRETLPFPLPTQNSIFSFLTLSHNDTQLCWQVYILSLVLTTWKQNKMNYEPMTMFGSRVP